MEKINISDSYYFYSLFYFSKPFNHNVISVTVDEVIKEKIQQVYEQMILEKIEATKKLPVESISIELLKALQDAVEIISKDYCRDFLS